MANVCRFRARPVTAVPKRRYGRRPDHIGTTCRCARRISRACTPAGTTGSGRTSCAHAGFPCGKSCETIRHAHDHAPPHRTLWQALNRHAVGVVERRSGRVLRAAGRLSWRHHDSDVARPGIVGVPSRPSRAPAVAARSGNGRDRHHRMRGPRSAGVRCRGRGLAGQEARLRQGPATYSERRPSTRSNLRSPACSARSSSSIWSTRRCAAWRLPYSRGGSPDGEPMATSAWSG